jgi:response regulator RpfG family c-di-GMP phosphodiesterase
MPLEKARGIIEEGSGSHFDPTVVAAFLAMVDDEKDAQP